MQPKFQHVVNNCDSGERKQDNVLSDPAKLQQMHWLDCDAFYEGEIRRYVPERMSLTMVIAALVNCVV